MKKYLIYICILIVISFPVKSFSNPLLVLGLFTYSHAVHITAFAAAAYYFMSAPTSTVNSTGDVTRNLQNGYVEIVNDEFVPHVDEIKAKLTYEDVYNLTEVKPTEYPSLREMMSKYAAPDLSTLSAGSSNPQIVSGSKYNTPYGVKTVTGPYNTQVGFCSLFNYSCYDNDQISETIFVDVTGRDAKWYTLSNADHPVQRTVVSPAEFTKNINTTASAEGGEVKTALEEELQKALEDPLYVPKFSDAETGLPYTPPASAATPAEIVGLEKKKEAQAAAAAALGAATTTTNNATNRYNTAVTNNINNPSADTQKELDNARAALDGAVAAENILKAEQAAAAADEAEKDVLPANVVTSALTGRSLNVDSFSQMGAAVKNLGPYQLLTGIEDTISQLVVSGSPTAPVITIPFVGSSLNIDLSILDPMAALCRWSLAFLTSIGTIMMLVRFWRGVS